MQRATGQYDHLARVPRTGPRQSSGRRSFASRHWCRATPRRSRGMEPTVRNPRIESAIGSDSIRTSLSADQFPSAGWAIAVPNSVARRCWPPKDPNISELPNGIGHQNPAAGTEFLDAETGGENRPERPQVSRRPNVRNETGENPHRKG
jgi:hypothetical protein